MDYSHLTSFQFVRYYIYCAIFFICLEKPYYSLIFLITQELLSGLKLCLNYYGVNSCASDIILLLQVASFAIYLALFFNQPKSTLIVAIILTFFKTI
jgi:hypothetical protein